MQWDRSLVWQALRLKNSAVAPVAATTSVLAGQKIKNKLSQVIDQGSDMEIEQLDHHSRQKYDASIEREEITDAQLSTLWAKVVQNQTPFVDMGLGPFWRSTRPGNEFHHSNLEGRVLEDSWDSCTYAMHGRKVGGSLELVV